MQRLDNLFSQEELEYLISLPEVLEARESLGSFTITLTPEISLVLKEKLGLDVSNKSSIPMRWIKGDTALHIDSGASKFKNTYLAYLTDSEGEFIIGEESFPITANTSFIFNEGIEHKTLGTSVTPRLLLGPMNEFAEPVGLPARLVYFSNEADAFAESNGLAYPHIAQNYSDYLVGTVTNGSIGPYSEWRIAFLSSGDPPSTVYQNGSDLSSLVPDGEYIYLYQNPGHMSAIFYYANYADAISYNNPIASSDTSYILGTVTTGSIQPYTSWRISYPSSSSVYQNGSDLTTIANSGTLVVYPAAPCFLEGTTVLCEVEGNPVYLPIETIKVGTYVKTSLNGYKKVDSIGKGQFYNSASGERIENSLYKCSTANYPELKQDLIMTGCHSILVDKLTDLQREAITKNVGKIFVTDKKYRLMACVDERAEPWNSQGTYSIWNLALENTDPKMNYGIYVNGGLLVESCCINTLRNKSNLTLA